MRRSVFALLMFTAATLAGQQWPQWGANAQHTSSVSSTGQRLDRNLADIVYDPFVPDEMEAVIAQSHGEGELLVHYQAPLVDGNDVYMMSKSGAFSPSRYATQTWNETKYRWKNGTLTNVWQFVSDWKPPGTSSDFWEPVFHPALANGVLYVPGAGGSILKVNKTTGVGIRINPFSNIDPNKFVLSPLTADDAGNIIYSVVQPTLPTSFYAGDIVDSWLVRVSPSDTVERVSYSTLTMGAPRGSDQCLTQFNPAELPWPPSPSAVPPAATCGTQRPGLNVAPAVAADGTIYVVTRAHRNSRESYLIAVRADLTVKWLASFRNRLHDGCGVAVAEGGVLPPNGFPGGCRAGSLLGVDPATNAPGGGRVEDSGSSSPVAAPDGSIYIGTVTRYNYAQGHLMHFAADGTFLNAYRFGWDITPGIYLHDGTYSVVVKDNHYGGLGSYCDDAFFCPGDRDATNPDYPEGYFVTQLSADMKVEWSFRNTNSESCSRDSRGQITCVSDHPEGFEWCVNAFVIDANGVIYANSEDGWLYAIAQQGIFRQRVFQQLALGAAYTPASIDATGRIYSQNAGHLFVAGTPVRRRAVSHQ